MSANPHRLSSDIQWMQEGASRCRLLLLSTLSSLIKCSLCSNLFSYYSAMAIFWLKHSQMLSSWSLEAVTPLKRLQWAEIPQHKWLLKGWNCIIPNFEHIRNHSIICSFYLALLVWSSYEPLSWRTVSNYYFCCQPFLISTKIFSNQIVSESSCPHTHDESCI